MNRTHGFVCEPTFSGNTELVVLVDLWGTFFDHRDRIGLSDFGDSETFHDAKEIIQAEARQILYGDLETQDDIMAGVPETMDGSSIWTVRAMLAAKDIRRQAQALRPRDFTS